MKNKSEQMIPGPKPEPFDVEAERRAVGIPVAYTTSQVARIVGMSESTVRRAISSGALEATRPAASRGYRISPAACSDWIKREGLCIIGS